MGMNDSFFQEAKARAGKFGVTEIVVASLNGCSVRRIRDVFGSGFRFWAVSNPTSAHEKGFVAHRGMTAETRDELEREGINVILADQGMFQAACFGGRCDIGSPVDDSVWAGAFKAISDWSFMADYGRVINKVRSGEISPTWLVTQTLERLFGDGLCVCLEVSMMAADSGKLPLGCDCQAIACPNPASHAPDAAVILQPQKARHFWNGLRIKDILLCPRPDDHWFCDKPLWPNG